MITSNKNNITFRDLVSVLNISKINKKKLHKFCMDAGLIEHAYGGGYAATNEAIEQGLMYTESTYKNRQYRSFIVITRKGLNHIMKLIKMYPRLIIPPDVQLKLDL
jgi:phage antirepressor YoqD-like protein